MAVRRSSLDRPKTAIAPLGFRSPSTDNYIEIHPISHFRAINEEAATEAVTVDKGRTNGTAAPKTDLGESEILQPARRGEMDSLYEAAICSGMDRATAASARADGAVPSRPSQPKTTYRFASSSTSHASMIAMQISRQATSHRGT
jgi:hypothetical protein